jgi:LysR family transcriptional regulator, glycine cleavage system transcriptional activator
MRRLPPFPELVAFEAVARLKSFTRAADELCVTQSAVSHRVRRLEKHFGAQLIQRLNPGIALTAAGAALLPELVKLLDGLAGLGGRRASERGRRLRVLAGNALCTWWLAGRLAGFMERRPDVSIELIPIKNDETPIPEADVRILWVGDDERISSPTQAPLFSEHVFPVCSPHLLPGRRPIPDARQLGAFPLLHKMTHMTGEWSWDVWIERLGMNGGEKRGELRFADVSLIMSAAIDGAGVALTRSLLAHDALLDGRLIVPIENVEPMLSSKKHVARWRRDRAGDPDIEAFVAWLVTEAKQTLAETHKLIHGRPTIASERVMTALDESAN